MAGMPVFPGRPWRGGGGLITWYRHQARRDWRVWLPGSQENPCPPPLVAPRGSLALPVWEGWESCSH